LNEPEHAPNGRDLNVVSLRDYIERVVNDQKVAVEAALKAHESAHTLEERALVRERSRIDEKMQELNNLRREYVSDRSQFVRTEFMEAELRPLKEFRSRAVGVGVAVALFAGAIGAALMKALGG
jgi:predicted  nucleic acid-binding Zn-ribbon protein